jgi:hypothetical protein
MHRDAQRGLERTKEWIQAGRPAKKSGVRIAGMERMINGWKDRDRKERRLARWTRRSTRDQGRRAFHRSQRFSLAEVDKGSEPATIFWHRQFEEGFDGIGGRGVEGRVLDWEDARPRRVQRLTTYFDTDMETAIRIPTEKAQILLAAGLELCRFQRRGRLELRILDAKEFPEGEAPGDLDDDVKPAV